MIRKSEWKRRAVEAERAVETYRAVSFAFDRTLDRVEAERDALHARVADLEAELVLADEALAEAMLEAEDMARRNAWLNDA